MGNGLRTVRLEDFVEADVILVVDKRPGSLAQRPAERADLHQLNRSISFAGSR